MNVASEAPALNQIRGICSTAAPCFFSWHSGTDLFLVSGGYGYTCREVTGGAPGPPLKAQCRNASNQRFDLGERIQTFTLLSLTFFTVVLSLFFLFNNHFSFTLI